jgi:hypothetical protein
MATTYTEAEFDQLSWHDCHIWRLELRAGDPEQNDWTTDLILDLDFILEWLCQLDGTCQFRVTPATLAFHSVSDLKINIDWSMPEHRAWLHELSVDRIEREPLPDPKFYQWTMRLNWPQAGIIAFTAAGFTQVLHSEGIVTDQQKLSLPGRKRLLTALLP